MGAEYARPKGAPVYFTNSLKEPNKGIWRLKPPGVTVIPKTSWGDWLALMALKTRYPNVSDNASRIKKEKAALKAQLAERETVKHAGPLAPIQSRLFKLKSRMLKRQLDKDRLVLDQMVKDPCSFARWPANRDQDWVVSFMVQRYFKAQGHAPPSYLARRRIIDAQHVGFSPEDDAQCRALARSLGVPEDRPLVFLHVREGGFKEDLINRDAEGNILKRVDSTRNADIRTYFPAIDRLVAQGYFVVRTGDPSMVKVERPGVFDLATSPGRTGLLELHLLSRSRFMIASESGPYHIAYMFGVPTLLINATDILGAYPIRPFDRYIFKRIKEKASGEILTFKDMIAERHYEKFRNIDVFEYLDNSPDEITAAVDEMLEMLAGKTEATPRQIQFFEQILEAAIRLGKDIYYIRKWGADLGFLGSGYICHSFAEVLHGEQPVVEATAATAPDQLQSAGLAPSLQEG